MLEELAMAYFGALYWHYTDRTTRRTTTNLDWDLLGYDTV
jgi:hypothetical protein